MGKSRWEAPVFGIFAMIFGAVGCVPPASERSIRSAYDPFTARLIQLSADQDGDGRLDQWTYLDGNRPLRGEGDSDGDGRIDRWEYFDGNAQLIKVGTSSQNDGVEDTWTYQDTSARIELSRKRDRQIDRREFYAGNALVRAEDDTNADGHIDQWARYEGGVLTEASFDVALATGRPDTRLRYDARGQFLAIETDRDGDGIFERVTDPAAAAAAKAGVQR